MTFMDIYNYLTFSVAFLTAPFSYAALQVFVKKMQITSKVIFDQNNTVFFIILSLCLTPVGLPTGVLI